MQNIFKILFTAILLFFTTTVYSQNCISPAIDPPECKKTEGLFQFKSPEYSGASIRLYLLGKKGDVITSVNSMTARNDVLILTVAYGAHYNHIPTSAQISIRSYSEKQLKYMNKPPLNIFLDDNHLVSEKMNSYKSFLINENFFYEIKFDDLLKITTSKKITFQIGNTEVELKPEEVKLFNEMKKTTEHLKYPRLYI